MWEVSLLVGQLLAVQEGNAVIWMTKESSINFIFKASRQFNSIQFIHIHIVTNVASGQVL
jgi:hypothetical protein